MKMNVQKLIEQYRDRLKKYSKNYKNDEGGGRILELQGNLMQLESLQRDMRKYLGQFSDKLNKANVGLGKKNEK